MGAVVVYGSIFNNDEFTQNGQTYVYLASVDGDSFEMSYSTLEKIKNYCEQFGVCDEDWPDYIDLGGYNIPVHEMLEHNDHLRERLAGLSPEQIQGMLWLDKIVMILQTGQNFYIH